MVLRLENVSEIPMQERGKSEARKEFTNLMQHMTAGQVSKVVGDFKTLGLNDQKMSNIVSVARTSAKDSVSFGKFKVCVRNKELYIKKE